MRLFRALVVLKFSDLGACSPGKTETWLVLLVLMKKIQFSGRMFWPSLNSAPCLCQVGWKEKVF